jgi:hypothetical protein
MDNLILWKREMDNIQNYSCHMLFIWFKKKHLLAYTQSTNGIAF